MPISDARRRASAKFQAKRKAAGFHTVTVHLSAEAMAALDSLAEAHGSKRLAIENALKQAKIP